MSNFEEYKFFSKTLLKEANDAAHREKRNKCINALIIESLSLDFVYHIIRLMYHRKNELRLFVEIDTSGKFELIDISITRYESLPTIRYFEDGSYEMKFYDRPYQNRREWQESEVLKPIRKQSVFRKMVLEAYNNCCSICEMNEVKLLRAAHILDVKDGGLDTIDNGIALCVNHEIAFDKGLIVIQPDYSLKCLDNIGVTVKKVKLPREVRSYPSTKYLKMKIKLYRK